MRVFLSWSGEVSRIAANALRDWLPCVLNIDNPWMSTEDLEPGKRWEGELALELEKTKIAIILVSKSNFESPWILFEAGASAKIVSGTTHVIPYLIGLESSDLSGSPLGIFQSVRATKEGTWNMVKSINSSLGEEKQTTEGQLKNRFDSCWPQLEKALMNLPKERTAINIRETKSIAFVINSGEQFNKQIKIGFSQAIKEIEKQHIRVVDREFLHTDAASFILALNRVEFYYPDYVIIVPPSKELANSRRDVGDILARLAHRNTRMIFIENAPDYYEEYNGLVTAIESDSEAGARILSQYVRSILGRDRTILLLNGPQDSENAAVRRSIYMQVLKDYNVITKDLATWSQSETQSYVENYLEDDRDSTIPDMIICGNDAMALGAVKAVRHSLSNVERLPKILGYDGLFRALMAIADEVNPFCATIRIPPSSYGMYAAISIIQDVIGTRMEDKSEWKKSIPINKENLIAADRANAILDRELWAL